MNMKKYNLLYLMAAATLLAGCASDELSSRSQLNGEVPISLTADINDAVFTRAGTAIQSTQFDVGETFYAFFKSGVRIGENVSPCSAIYTTTDDDTDGTVDGISTPTQPYFASAATEATVHAYYPYYVDAVTSANSVTVTNTTESFSVQTDQSTTLGYKKSDLMYGTVYDTSEPPQPTTIAKSSTLVTATLTFTHKLSKIIINAEASTGLKIQGIRIIGGKRTIDIPEDGRETCTLGTTLSDANDATTNYITMYSDANGAASVECAAIIPPQTIDGNFLQIITDKGNATYSLSSKAFASGQVYTTNLTVTLSSINLTTAITDWGDGGTDVGYTDAPQTLGELTEWINYYGNLATPEPERYNSYLGWYVKSDGTISQNATDAIGIIAYMSTDDVDVSVPSSRILVLSSEDVATNTKWGPNLEATAGISTSTEDMNGLSNTILLDCLFGDEYAGKKCYTYSAVRPYQSSKWFLPSYAQWASMMGANGVKKYKAGLSNTSFWSSTEYDTEPSKAGTINEEGSTRRTDYKTTENSVRACFVYPNKGIIPNIATRDNIGWVIASNGLMYENASKAAEFGQTAVAMIAYVGSQNGENGTSAYSSTYNHGLAVALTDVADINGNIGSGTMPFSSALTAVSAFKYSHPSTSSSWMLPSAYQWQRIFEACGGSSFTALSDGMSFNYGNFETNLTNCGGNHTLSTDSNPYWSSTVYDTNNAWHYNFDDNKFRYRSKTSNYYVRACFAF